MFNYNKALAWLSEVRIRLDMFGTPADKEQRHRLNNYMKVFTFKCHTEMPYRQVFLQELSFMADVHSIATHSRMMQDQPDGECVRVCALSFIHSGQLYYVSTWGCLTCTSLYFSAYSWSRRLQIYYSDKADEQEELFPKITCHLCFGFTHWKQ